MEIIPKKQIRTTLPWQNILLYVSLAIFIVACSSSFILFYLETKAKNNLLDVEDRIARVGTKEEKVIEKNLFADSERIRDFSSLLAQYKKSSNFFNFFEGIVHPAVWFSELELSLERDQVQTSGRAQNFQSLGQQLLIFQNQSLISSSDLSDIAIGKKGDVDFAFQLLLEPKVLNNN